MKSKPFLKWAGGKYRCLQHILRALPKSERLIEPFTGSGAVFINAPFDEFLLGEANADLVILYQMLQKEGNAFINFCERFFRPEHNTELAYYTYRSQFNALKIGSKKRAALFLYLNRHGYNGLCRYNLKGSYNVPFGRYKKPYFPRQELLTFYERCQKAHFVTADFSETFMQATPGDVIYCDPPYAPLSKTSQFTTYTQRKFGEAEQIKLAALAKTAAEKNIPVIISNHDTPFTRALYKDASCHSFPVQRNISCKGNQRVAVREIIAVFRC